MRLSLRHFSGAKQQEEIKQSYAIGVANSIQCDSAPHFDDEDVDSVAMEQQVAHSECSNRLQVLTILMRQDSRHK